METFVAIIRWFFGLIFAAIMFSLAVTVIPITIFGSQVLDRNASTQWIESITSDKEVMDSLVTGILKGVAESESTSSDSQINPSLSKVFVNFSDATTKEGRAIRNIFDQQTLKTNINNNADIFFNWLEGRSEKMNMVFKFGGTNADHVLVMTEILYAESKDLPPCPKGTSKVNVAKINAGNCSPSSLRSDYEKIVIDGLKSAEVQEVIKNGYATTIPSDASTRESFLMLKSLAGIGLIITWIVIVFCSLFMILLFTPKGVNLLATGIILSVTGTMVSSMGGGMLALFSATSNVGGAASIASAFAQTLGKPIALQGTYMIALGGLLAIWGIVILINKGGSRKKVTVPSVKSETTEVKEEIKVVKK